MGNWGVCIKLYKTNEDLSEKVAFGLVGDYRAIAEYLADGYHSSENDMSDYSELIRTLDNQRLMIRFYWCPDVDATPVLWYQQCSWATELLTAVLDPVIWTLYYDLRQVGVLRPDYFLDYNCPADNTRIENFSYTPVVPPPPPLVKSLISPPHITEPQIARPFIRLFPLCLCRRIF